MRKRKPADENLDGFVDKLDEIFEARVRGVGDVPELLVAPEHDRQTSLDRAGSRPSFRKLLPILLVFVGIPGVGGAIALYRYFSLDELFRQRAVAEEPAEPATAAATSAVSTELGDPDPTPESSSPPAVPSGTMFGIQVAICLRASCVAEYQERLFRQGLPTFVEERWQGSEIIEIYSRTGFDSREQAVATGSRIDSEYGLRGRVEVFNYGSKSHLALGAFVDLARATDVRDALNRQFAGQATFGTRVSSATQKLNVIVAGIFDDSIQAATALERIVQADSLFGEAYIVRQSPGAGR